MTVSRWEKFSLGKQIISIAAETNRAAHWIRRKDIPESKRCLERAVELIQVTLMTQLTKSRRRELARFKEVLLSYWLHPDISEEEIKKAQRVLISLSPESWAMVTH